MDTAGVSEHSKRMSTKTYIPLIALAALLLVVVVTYLRQPGSGPQTTGAQGLTGGHPPISGAEGAPSTSPTPSADNVRHDFKARLAELELAIARNPADTTALQELARLRFDAHDMKAAEQHLAAYLARHPANRQAWLDLATAQASLSDWDSARSTTERMLDRYPGDVAAEYNMGAILANMGRKEEAAEWWRRVAESDDATMAMRARQSLEQLGL